LNVAEAVVEVVMGALKIARLPALSPVARLPLESTATATRLLVVAFVKITTGVDELVIGNVY
jgi:hypothetical protein